MFTIDELNDLIVFLNRVELKGSEVPNYVAVLNRASDMLVEKERDKYDSLQSND